MLHLRPRRLFAPLRSSTRANGAAVAPVRSGAGARAACRRPPPAAARGEGPGNRRDCPSVSRIVNRKRSLGLFVALLGARSLVAACGGTGRDAADSCGHDPHLDAGGRLGHDVPDDDGPGRPTVPAGGTVPAASTRSRLPPYRPASTGCLVTRPAPTRCAPRSCGRPTGGPISSGFPAPVSPLLEGPAPRRA